VRVLAPLTPSRSTASSPRGVGAPTSTPSRVSANRRGTGQAVVFPPLLGFLSGKAAVGPGGGQPALTLMPSPFGRRGSNAGGAPIRRPDTLDGPNPFSKCHQRSPDTALAGTTVGDRIRELLNRRVRVRRRPIDFAIVLVTGLAVAALIYVLGGHQAADIGVPILVGVTFVGYQLARDPSRKSARDKR